MLSSLLPTESLILWREPNAYVRKDLSHGRWIGLLVVFSIPSWLLLWSASSHGFTERRVFVICLFQLLAVVGAVVTWFGSGPAVCLKDDHISKREGRYASQTSFQNIASCSVHPDVYNGTKFVVLKFEIKKGLPSGQVTEAAVPNNATLNHILQILRDKGVKIVGDKVVAGN